MIIGMFKHTFAHHLTAMLLSNTSSSSLHSLLAAFGRYEGRAWCLVIILPGYPLTWGSPHPHTDYRGHILCSLGV